MLQLVNYVFYFIMKSSKSYYYNPETYLMLLDKIKFAIMYVANQMIYAEYALLIYY